MLQSCTDSKQDLRDYETVMDDIFARRKSRMELHEFVCKMQCPIDDPELEGSVADLRMAEHHWSHVADYCRNRLAPMLLWFTDDGSVKILNCRRSQSLVPWMRLFHDLVRLLVTTLTIVRLPMSNFILAVDPNDWAVPSEPAPRDDSQYLRPLPGLARFVGTDAHSGVLLPTNQFILASSMCKFNSRVRWWQLCPLYDGSLVPWSNKSSIVFWRGLPTGNPFSSTEWRFLPRSKLVREFRYANGYDVGFTRGLKKIANSSKELHAEMTQEWFQREPVSFSGHLHFKYLLHLDGNTASWGLTHKLNSGSAVFWVASPRTYREHFYRLLKPWVHYVPISADMSDLESARRWALQHDDEVHKIAEQARNLIAARLRPQDLFCYLTRLLMSVSAAQVKGNSRVSEQGLRSVLGPMVNEFYQGST